MHRTLATTIQGGLAISVNQGPFGIAQALLGDVPLSQQINSTTNCIYKSESVKLYVDGLQTCAPNFYKMYFTNS